MDKKNAESEKPNLGKHLFWDFRYKDIEWRKEYVTIIERVIERGNKEDWKEMIRFYTTAKVIYALKYEIAFLANYAIEDACNHFSLRKEDLRCWIRSQTRVGYWI